MSIRRKIRKAMIKRKMRLPAWCMTDRERVIRKIAAGVPSDGIVIDLGAYVGEISKEFAYYAKKVYAFEPHPEIFKRLQENTRTRSNIECVQAAVSEEDGVCTLFSDPEPDETKLTQGSSIMLGKSNLSYENSFEVKTISLPDFIRSLDEDVALIKMDIEGMEYRIINSLIESGVMTKVGMVYVEDHCDRIPDLSIQRDATLSRIENEGLSDRFNFDWP
ncbi:FkbM family methyltransferase [Breoghania sp.]|uniref:FkbM family methyltransferase n=1 Tax=Breoghania sp. TaxID=2065378 RepID=UPI002AA95652|nr:FkbM family methyltransferase [Breoghania sp.]